MLPRPIDFWLTNYHATIDSDNCNACEACIERCQLSALSIDESLGVAAIDLDRCIGCGVCVSSCPLEAIRLIKKEREIVPPVDIESLHDSIMAKKGGNPS